MTIPDGTPAHEVPESEFQAIAALAYNFYQQGKLQEAETLFRFVQMLNPQAYYAYAGVGVVALAQQPPNLEEAYENLVKAAELNSTDPSVQASLGEVLLRKAEIEQAAVHLRKAIELDPKRKDPGVTRARVILSGLTSVANRLRKVQTGSAA